jgi:tRNA(Glu) U13 pseudouridine synthase TruD
MLPHSVCRQLQVTRNPLMSFGRWRLRVACAAGGSCRTLRLLAGPENFLVEEIPAYEPEGRGEHLFVHVRKRGMNTETVAEALARCCGVGANAVGFAGRKDRQAVATQWFSIHGGAEERLAALTTAGVASCGAAGEQQGGSIEVLAVSRHRNKMRLGHLLGNRFRLGLAADDEREHAALVAHTQRLLHEGVPNRFGTQRFGQHHASLHAARAVAAGDFAGAVARIVDPTGAWRPGHDPLPSTYRSGPEGHVLGALRRAPRDYRGALRAGGRPMERLLSGALQSAIFNACLDARRSAGLLHRLRPGDVALGPRGGAFVVTRDECAELNARAAPGALQIRASGPLPGANHFDPDATVLAEELAWSSSVLLAAAPANDGGGGGGGGGGGAGAAALRSSSKPPDAQALWQALQAPTGMLAAHGERRPLLMQLRGPPQIEPWGGRPVDGASSSSSSRGSSKFALELDLPPGAYATTVLDECGVAVPKDRSASPREY